MVYDMPGDGGGVRTGREVRIEDCGMRHCCLVSYECVFSINN